MRLDDRAADREPDADAARLCRVETVEDVRDALGVDADAVILDANRGGFAVGPACARSACARLRGWPAIASSAFVTRLTRTCCSCTGSAATSGGGVASSMRTATRCRSIAPRDRARTVSTISFRFTSWLLLRLLVEQGADPRDHVAGPVAVGDDAARRLARIVEQRRIALQRAQAGAAIRRDRGQRLVDLVRDRGGEFGHRRQAQGAGQLRLGIAQRPLGGLRARPFPPSAPHWPAPARRCVAEPSLRARAGRAAAACSRPGSSARRRQTPERTANRPRGCSSCIAPASRNPPPRPRTAQRTAGPGRRRATPRRRRPHRTERRRTCRFRLRAAWPRDRPRPQRAAPARSAVGRRTRQADRRSADPRTPSGRNTRAARPPAAGIGALACASSASAAIRNARGAHRFGPR